MKVATTLGAALLALFFLSNVASKKGLAREINSTAFWDFKSYRDIELTVGVLGNVSGLISDDSIADPDKYSEAKFSFAGRARVDDAFNALWSVPPHLRGGESVSFEKSFAHCTPVSAQLFPKSLLGISEANFISFRKIAFKRDPNTSGWCFAVMFGCGADSERVTCSPTCPRL